MESQEQLAARHIALRERAGLTQEQEAKIAGVSPTTISGIESGKITRPHLKTLLKLARALGVDVGELREAGKVEAPPSQAKLFNNGVSLGTRPAEPEAAEFLEWARGATVSELREEQDRWLAGQERALAREDEYFEARGGKPKERDALLALTRDPEYRRLQEDTFYATRRLIWITNELRRRPFQTAATIIRRVGARALVRWFIPEEERGPYRERFAVEMPEGYDEEEAEEGRGARVQAVEVFS